MVEGAGFDPYANLALEKLLLERVAPSQCVLYLWQNERTVVIGRNQSALAEVRVAELEAAGGKLARRLSGGGAVYHDLGNLNFTFVCRGADYDVARQTEVILQAVRALGIPAERTGRNDLVVGPVGGTGPGTQEGAAGGSTAQEGPTGGSGAQGGKFSGHAYYRSGPGPEAACYHHGTLMVDVDKEALGRYLRPAPDKLRAKGVASVRSRVVNLAELAPGLDVEQVAAALRAAFRAEYGLPFSQVDAGDFAGEELERYTAQMGSRAWLFRDERALGHVVRGRFAWGGVTLRYELAAGSAEAGTEAAAAASGVDGAATLAACVLDSDGLEADYLARVPAALVGCPLERAALEARLRSAAKTETQRAVARDVAALLGGERGAGD